MMAINLDEIPDNPGVYTFIDKNGKILYVGKAISLKKRLSSYFNSSPKSPKTVQMLSLAHEVRYIITTNEVEALLLENNIIKNEKPKYNIRLKDAKSYPYIKLTEEEFQRIIITRDTSDKNALYFGPFVNVNSLRGILNEILKIFPIRTCSDGIFKKKKVCLNYQIKQCSGPCEEMISKEDYKKLVDEVKKLFTGKVSEIKENLKEKMFDYSKNLLFEEAAKIRDRINALDSLFTRQGVVINDEKSSDIFILKEDQKFKIICSLFIRNGKLLSVKTEFIDDDDFDISLYILQLYSITQQPPESIGIIVNDTLIKNSDPLIEAVYKTTGHKVSLMRSIDKKILEIGIENIEVEREFFLKKQDNLKKSLEKLSSLTNCDVNTIECVDISHLYGKNVVGASVCWSNGEFIKSRYRRYKITNETNDDFTAIYELMSRKANNILDGSEQKSDLYIIDGGIGQLNAALKAFKEKNLNAFIISISKGRSLKEQRFDSEETIASIHLPNRKNPVKPKRNDPMLLLIEKIRDEAHRFVINYMRKSYEKILLKSGILDVEGIGEKRLKKILSTYPDILDREITKEELSKNCNLPLTIAEKLIHYIKKIKDEVKK
ncbi:MAG: excinuclease ABC subunit UvrC [Calditerrivibrio sp.]|uniref:excinuclease ABC subunit UvrC n=1 Tax=Calditerrivibrio sp. TaxID=2792612 RepID=UPI003D0B414D